VTKRIYNTSRRRSKPDQTPYLTHARRHQTKADMADWGIKRITDWHRHHRHVVHIVIKMVTADPEKMTNRIDRYRKRLNGACAGSYWYEHGDDRLMVGIRFYERRGDYIHAHILASPPPGCDVATMLRLTKHILGHEPDSIKPSRDDHGNPCWIATTKSHGGVWMREVANTDEDRSRVVNYVLKSLETDPEQYQEQALQWEVLEKHRGL
jgi:hypothetical protein